MTSTAAAARPAAPAPDRSAELTRALTYFVLLAMVAAFMWAYRETFYAGKPYPYDSFLFHPDVRWRDTSMFFGAIGENDPYQSLFAVYLPFAYLVMEPFKLAGYSGTTLLWTIVAAGGIGWFVALQLDFLRIVDRVGATLALTFATYPFIFSFDRGNVEIVVTVLLAGFAFCLQTRRTMAAAVIVGAMIALKGYPAIFAVVFLVRGQWRPLAVCVGVAVILTFLGSTFYSFDLPHTLDLLRHNLHTYNDAYAIGDGGLGFGCSLYGALKLLVVDVLGGTNATMRTVLPIYEAATAVLLAGLVWALWKLPLKLWEQVALLTLAFNALPAVSGDYKLLHLVIPMVLFLRDGGEDRNRWWYLAGFALLMVPKAYIVLRPDGTNIAVVLDPLIMTALAVLIVVSAARRRGTAAPVAARANYSPA
jgi:hypothetical protein